MNPFETTNALEQEAAQSLGIAGSGKGGALNPEMQIVLFDTRDVIQESDPNAGTWIP